MLQSRHPEHDAMALMSVADARSRILAEARPLANERVDLMECDGRVLGEALAARRTQPPFDVSAMDGYAVRQDDVGQLPARLEVIAEAAAGRGYDGQVGPGQAVRIFTGAPVPEGADAIVIQEDTERDGDKVIVTTGAPEPGHIRKCGIDFQAGSALLDAGRRLTPRDVTLAAAMGHDRLAVRRKPVVAILATGDELVLPGEPVGRDQIVCSNPFGIAAMVAR
ncbi:MAG: molybdopterin molybdotransferase MoeA, partial [Hyphomicrobiaceae bacterium]